MNRTTFAKFAATCGVFLACSAVDARADEICRPCPFDCMGIGASHEHCSDRGVRYGQCCVDLDHRGQRILSDTDRYNSSRAQFGGNPGWRGNDCPPGFNLRGSKCSDEERRRGCNDMHSPSGQTCVGWNQRPRR